ncbi:MAG: hypothetical protein ACWGSD_18990, partial [Thermodesulfobacteriota bacterium]
LLCRRRLRGLARDPWRLPGWKLWLSRWRLRGLERRVDRDRPELLGGGKGGEKESRAKKDEYPRAYG